MVAWKLLNCCGFCYKSTCSKCRSVGLNATDRIVCVQIKKTDAALVNVRMRRVRVGIVAVEKHCVLIIHLACAVLYRPMWPVWLYHIFSTSHKRFDFRKKTLLNMKRAFLFSLQLLCETFLVLRRNQWDVTINVYRSSCKSPVILVRF